MVSFADIKVCVILRMHTNTLNLHSVDATTDDRRKGRLLNHSKENFNVVSKVFTIDDTPRLCLLAARNIDEGEELVYDYGERNSEAVQCHPWLKK